MSGLRKLGRNSSDDPKRFTQLYQETHEDLLAFLLRRCPTANDAADCMAETFRIAWEKRTRIPAGNEARLWLYGVARNVLRKERTRDQRTAAVSRELALAAERSQLITSPEDSAMAVALSELSELDREIITMLSWDGLAPRDVASILGMSPNVVRVRAHRTRQRLRARMASDSSERSPTPDISSAPGGGG